ncbi:hypothetical protein N7478_002086 [Penicillium angulare]|uniref:uncharacterized protein n=1 Tax=Penicillium angulare TaxID=116970 RepID=UPI002540FE93|nr:uncharacterized protein N7478_002086 [Penicillium angulare]KAJ5289056.1 hypothetical protein N7478_002086 [Penicillium angulare]
MQSGDSSNTKPDGTGVKIIWRDNADPAIYEDARTKRLFNAQKPQRYPIAIAFVKDAQQIVEVVNVAHQLKCQVSVRAGGHSYAGWSVRDDAILIDMGEMSKGPTFDEDTSIVSIPPAVTGTELVNYLAPKGRVCSVGHCHDVGLGGFLLGGGMGWNCNNWGWACEQLIAVDVVTAAGQLVRADDQNHSDLFWAAKGAGPAFPGIVTRFHLLTKPTVKCMLSSGYVYPISNLESVLSWVPKFSAHTSGQIEVLVMGSYPPGLNQLCVTVSIVAYGDSVEQVIEALQPAEDSHQDGTVAHWFCEATSMERQLEITAPAFPTNHRYYVDNLWLNDGTDLSVLQPAFESLPTKESLVLLQSMRPGSQRSLPDMALSMQSNYWLSMYAIWDDQSDDPRCQSAVHYVITKLEKYSKGSYIGELDPRARKAKYWKDDHRERLIDIRQKWDPQNRLCGCLGLKME